MPEFSQASIQSSKTFPVRNRKWQLTMVPKSATVSALNLTVNLPVLFLGILLSFGLSLLVYLLLRRMEMFRLARDQQALLSRKVLMAQDDIIWLNLDNRAGFVLSLVDGELSLDEILSVCSLPQLDALRILVQLLQEKVIEVV